MVYKWCVVAQCTNTTINSPNTMFVSVPTNPKRRKMWLQLARRDPKSIAMNSNVFMCEDHFDMEKDTKNHMKYKMGFSQKILLADDAVPTKFHCQDDRKRRLSYDEPSRAVILKGQRTEIVAECLQGQSAIETHAGSLQKDDMTQIVIESEDERLIAAVYKREPLWNPASELHKNSVVLKKLWNSIAIELGKDVTSIKTRWKNLRAYFIKVHRKSDNGDQMSTITWQFYDQLSFLKCCSPGLEREFVRVENEDSNSSIGETIDENNYGNKANSDSDSNSSQSKRKRPRISMTTKYEPLELPPDRNRSDEIENYQERNLDDQQFFESLLPYVKNIPMMRKLKLRCKIQEMILKELEAVENDIAQQQARFSEVYVEPVVQNALEPNFVNVKNEPVDQSED